MTVAPRSFSSAWMRKLLFGNEPSRELFGILTVYFVQGILGLARLAISFFLKDELGLSPAEMGALMGIAAFPWIVKPLFGFISDGLPILGYRRRPYLILSGLLGSMAWIALGTVVHTSAMATVAILMSSVSVAISDVIADSLVVERARTENIGKAGSLQSLTWGVSALGGLVTAYLSGLLLEHLSTRAVFEITAVFPLLVAAVAGAISEQPPEEEQLIGLEPAKEQLGLLWQAIKQKTIWLPTLFVFIWQATPGAESAFFYFSTNELGFEAEFLGRVRLVTSLASLLGIWVFQRYLKTIPFRKIFGWSIVISTLLGLTSLILVTHFNRTLGIGDAWFSLGDSLVLTVVGQIAFMPVLVLSARLCPPGVEATMFALLMSIFNLAGLLSQELGALLTHLLGVTETNFDRLWLLVTLTNLSTLLPLFAIKWLPQGDPQAILSETLPPGEIFEHRVPGSQLDSTTLPDVLPQLTASQQASET